MDPLFNGVDVFVTAVAVGGIVFAKVCFDRARAERYHAERGVAIAQQQLAMEATDHGRITLAFRDAIAGLNRFVWALEEQVPRSPRIYDQERA